MSGRKRKVDNENLRQAVNIAMNTLIHGQNTMMRNTMALFENTGVSEYVAQAIHPLNALTNEPAVPLNSCWRSSPRDLDRLYISDDGKFQRLMKLSRRQLENIYCELQRIGVNPRVKIVGLMCLLHFLTDSDSSFEQLAGMMDVDVGVAEGLVESTAEAIVSNLQEFSGLQWPDDMMDMIRVLNYQSRSLRVAGVLGHASVVAKNGQSIIIQLVVDHDGVIRYFKMGFDAHPLDLLKSSSLYHVLTDEDESWKILCDASYEALPIKNLLPPYSGEMRIKQREYNHIHYKTRQILAQTFKDLFGYFPKLNSLDSPSAFIIGAALVFYNIIQKDLDS